jgi:hypothetical protein
VIDFLDVALRNARRGFRVHPLTGKDAMLKEWPRIATTDEAQIHARKAIQALGCIVGGGLDFSDLSTDYTKMLHDDCTGAMAGFSLLEATLIVQIGTENL